MKRTFLILISILIVCGGLFAQNKRLDTTSFIVLGEGLAAGMGNFSLSQATQEYSFPAQMARQMGTLVVQPLIQPPGIGNAPGFTQLPIRIPGILQTTVRTQNQAQFSLYVTNLSVPGMRLADAISRRPQPPLIHRNDELQTSINFILGFPALVVEVDGKKAPLWNQIEYAQNMFPTLALVELGYYEVLEAAVKGDATLLPDPAVFRTNYAKVVAALRGQFADVVVTTIPDPLSTAYFSNVSEAAQLLRTLPYIIAGLWDVKFEDYITIPGLNEMGPQILDRNIKPLSSGSVLRQTAASAISARVKALNAVISDIAKQNGAVLCDLNALFNKVDAQGVTVGGRTLTSGYLGGFYQLNGYYPGITGQALIANEILAALNKQFGNSLTSVNAASLLASDPAANSIPVAQGPDITTEELIQGLTINGSPISGETAARLRLLSQSSSDSPKTDK